MSYVRRLKTRRGRSRKTDAGSALVEAVTAVAVMVSVTAGIALMIVRSRQAVAAAGAQSLAVAAAQQKLEQLCALEWSIDAAGSRKSDSTSDLSTDSSRAGTGLRPGPADALDRPVMGFADFLAADGGWRAGPDPPPDAAFARRWSIAPYPADPDDTLVLTVVVLPAGGASRVPLATLQTIRTRTTR